MCYYKFNNLLISSENQNTSTRRTYILFDMHYRSIWSEICSLHNLENLIDQLLRPNVALVVVLLSIHLRQVQKWIICH